MLSRSVQRPLAGGALMLLAAACGSSDERVAVVSSPIVGGSLSTAAEDFIVYLAWASPEPTNVRGCGAALVAPNLLLTAKHCVRQYQEGVSFCDSSGEPQPGSEGGYTTGEIPLGELKVFRGIDARGQFVQGKEHVAVAKQIIDDRTTTLCSHDLAYVVLDRPITDAPIAKLRLDRRPDAAVDEAIAIAGWGKAEKGAPYNGLFTQVRLTRTGVPLLRVGAAVPDPDIQGSLAPKTFETGPGGCSGDSGSPGFDPRTGTVLGVLVRALNTDPYHEVSPCAPDTVRNVYLVPNDFASLLREAFTAAGAEPSREGEAAAGYATFGDTCTSALECAGAICSAGHCNVDCANGATCPNGLVCGSSGACESPPAAPPAETPPAATPIAPSSSCSTMPVSAPEASRGVLLVFAACVAFARRLLRRPRLRL